MNEHTCGQCECYRNPDNCPHPERTAFDEGCDEFKYTNPEKRIDFLQAENKQQVDLLVLAKEEMDAQAAENKRLKEALEKRKGAAAVLQQIADKLKSLTGEQNVWKAIELLTKP